MGPLIRNVSDTALWVASYRAEESERPDAVFHDPYAKRLGGKRGEEIARSMSATSKTGGSWPIVARTYLIDKLVMQQLRQGVDMVINLAAGLDSRPYRMKLPPTLKWVEIDLQEILAYKEQILANDKPVCELERIAMDLSDADKRHAIFEQLSQKASKALIISEGLVVYLKREDVAALATDLNAQKNFHYWILDLASPGLLRMLQKNFGEKISQAPMQFGPEEGAGFFHKYGWQTVEVHSQLKAAGRLKRLPLMLRWVALLPESKRPAGSRPWSGVCLFERQ